MTFVEDFPNYFITSDGRVFKNNVEMPPFRSNKYLQVVLYNVNHKRHIFGVHTLVAMLYLPDYYVGCIVHHKDGNCHNNCVANLEVMSRSTHTRNHNKDNRTLANYVKEHGPHNKGKKMSDDFCRKCSNSAKLRGFNGNQYVNANKTKRNNGD